MFENTAVSVRLKKTCAKFIAEFFTNKQEFMRRAIEHYCEVSMERIQHPQGGVSINFYEGGYGMVQYYWNYYKGRQFIVITNESGFPFQEHAIEFRTKIFEKLKITSNEIIDFYVPYRAVVVKPDHYEERELDHVRVIWRRDVFLLWDFEARMSKDRSDAISDEVLVEMMHLMNCHNSHYVLNRRAFVFENLYNATIEWENLPSLKCKRIVGV